MIGVEMSDPTLWVDLPKETRLHPSPLDILPDFVLHNPENTQIALHGCATWESLEYCLSSGQRLVAALDDLATAIRGGCKSRKVQEEIQFLQDSLLRDHESNLNTLADDILPAAITALEDIFVPSSQLQQLREPLTEALGSMAKMGELLEKFTNRGMKKRLSLLRSSNIFKQGELLQFQRAIQDRFGRFEKGLFYLVTFCKRGGRFNIAPNGEVRFSHALGRTGGQDPQVTFDEAFKDADNRDTYYDMIDMIGLGPRRDIRELAGVGAMEIRIAGGPPVVI